MKASALTLSYIFIFCLNLSAQANSGFNSARIDSVQRVLERETISDTLKVIALNHLARLFIADYQYEKGLRFGLDSRELAIKIAYPVGEGLYLRFLDELHFENNWRPLDFLTRWHFEDLNLFEPQINIPDSPSGIDFATRNQAIERAASIFENSGDLQVAAHLYLLTALNKRIGNNLSEAHANVEKAITIFQKLNLPIPLLQSNLLFAIILNDLEKDSQEFKNQMVLNTKFVEEQDESREKVLMYILQESFYRWNTNLSEIALDNLFEAVKISERLQNDDLLFLTYSQLGTYFLFQDIYQKSVEYYAKSADYFEKILPKVRNNSKPIANEDILYGFYSMALSRAGNFKKAREILELGKARGMSKLREVDAEGTLLLEQGFYSEALEKFYDYNELQNSPRELPNNNPHNNNYIARCLSGLGRLNESNRFAEKSFQLSRESNGSIFFTPSLFTSCILLFENNEKLGNKEEAYKYLKYYMEIVKEKEARAISDKASNLEIQAVINASNEEKEALEKEKIKQEKANQNQRWWLFSIAAGLFSSFVVVALLFKNNKNKQKANALLLKQKVEINRQREKAETAFLNLKFTQAQLIQQEKLASLGQLTAGIAHEIKNPLNFVNNFSEVSMELIEEAKEERGKSLEARDETLVDEILEDIKSNLTKIHEHGTRANGIVTSMLQHSRGGSGKMTPTDLNALIKEYVNLSFHGMRAGKNPIDVEIALDLDPEIHEVPLIKEDFTRVVINLCNNAFDAMRGKKYLVSSIKYQDEEENDIEYLPKLKVITSIENGQVRISIEDNGPGIPDDIKDKILQPFFTTKKGTEGTGLGLSITHDIVKAHGGELNVESKEGQGSKFSVQLPKNNHK